jgi:hypothetical protein
MLEQAADKLRDDLGCQSGIVINFQTAKPRALTAERCFGTIMNYRIIRFMVLRFRPPIRVHK